MIGDRLLEGKNTMSWCQSKPRPPGNLYDMPDSRNWTLGPTTSAASVVIGALDTKLQMSGW